MQLKNVPSFAVSIFIAGDPPDARRACRRYCNDVGLCVTVTETEFVYSGGAETGALLCRRGARRAVPVGCPDPRLPRC